MKKILFMFVAALFTIGMVSCEPEATPDEGQEQTGGGDNTGGGDETGGGDQTGDGDDQTGDDQKPVVTKYYKVTVPAAADFATSKIIKLQADGKKIGEACLEYLGTTIDKRAVVIYAGIDYTTGVLAYYVDAEGNATTDADCGGVVSVGYNTNVISYTAGSSSALSEVYISEDGAVTAEAQTDATDATLAPYLISDLDGNAYPVVKIGRDVWMAANLSAKTLANNVALTVVDDGTTAGSHIDAPAACYPNNDTSISLVEYGLLYNIQTLVSAANLVGAINDDGYTWRVSTGAGAVMLALDTDWERLFTFVGSGNLGSILTPGYSWKTAAFDGNATNITGFSATPAGENYDNGLIPTLGFGVSCFVAYATNETGHNGFNLADDASSPEFAGVRPWTHQKDWCTIRLVRDDVRE